MVAPSRIPIVLSNCSFQQNNLNSQALTGVHQTDPVHDRNTVIQYIIMLLAHVLYR